MLTRFPNLTSAARTDAGKSFMEIRDQALSELESVKDIAGLNEFVIKYFVREGGLLNKEVDEVKLRIWVMINQKRGSITEANIKNSLLFTRFEYFIINLIFGIAIVAVIAMFVIILNSFMKGS